MGSGSADVIMTSALTWSTFTKSTVNGSTARSAGSVVSGSHRSVSQETPTCGARMSGPGKRKRKGQGGVYGLKEVGPARRPNISAWLSLVRGSVTWAGLRERLAGRLGCAARLTGLVEDGGPSSSSSFSFPILHGRPWAGAALAVRSLPSLLFFFIFLHS